ncbi:response regulator [Tropicimonas sp. IMCC34043]|uniref:response regulator n=1 Tax=Tropicimonas sp. IMCC34043 TaxID=2248760 RepID=UPI000E21F9DD|nr:response regulator [Tropicimonas sp. IMCC34043]
MALREVLEIMVVDDMSTSRGMLVQALDVMGVLHVRHAPDGNAALRALWRRPAHLVISDFCMPGMDGLQLLQALRQDPGLGATAFILISGRAEPHVIAAGRVLGMNQFLAKPFAILDLQKVIESVVGRL